MDAIVEGCKQDEDCPEKQYCYKLSKHCVNYTICSRYNRLETDKLARNPSQCGPCIAGYTIEVLANGEDALHCTKKIRTEDSLSMMDQTAMMWIIVGTLCSLISLVIVGYMLFKIFFKKWYSCKRKVIERKCVEFGDTSAVAINASAPPEDRNPFIHSNEETHDNSTVIAIDKLVGATAWRAPNWVSNANYGTNRLGDDYDNVPGNEENSIVQLPIVHNAPNDHNSSSQPLTIQLPESSEDQDNARNIVWQTYLSDHDSNTDNNTNNNSDDNNTNPTPEPNENGNTHGQKKTAMLINQMLKNITMNVNVINVNEV